MAFVPKISAGGAGLPNRVLIYAVEGFGKTSLGAFAPSPLFGMSRGETGLLTLQDNGRVPAEVPSFKPDFQSWGEAYGSVEYLLRNPDVYPDRRCLVLDTGNGLALQAYDHICDTAFGGDRVKCDAFGAGAKALIPVWNDFLALLDRLRTARRMGVMILAHAKVKKFNNPEGEDYDRYSIDMLEEIRGLTYKWADLVLFGNFKTLVKKGGFGKAKGKDDQGRYLFTRRTPAFDAKNRHGLPFDIAMGNTPEQGWRNLSGALKKSREAGVQPETYDDDPDAPPAAPPAQTPPAAPTPPAPVAPPAEPAKAATNGNGHKNGTAAPPAKETPPPGQAWRDARVEMCQRLFRGGWEDVDAIWPEVKAAALKAGLPWPSMKWDAAQLAVGAPLFDAALEQKRRYWEGAPDEAECANLDTLLEDKELSLQDAAGLARVKLDGRAGVKHLTRSECQLLRRAANKHTGGALTGPRPGADPSAN